ncbi:type 2 isopentenyl-diphosphate Delta-isomerase [Lactobacillus sp. LC28-10]|uniref:Isopentenyl-diphosphate delta-isomerase n=1 Tax=Secundilactobacillus angelensis TaxID=2722706 RepID=A0ABX1KY32_9LACO|nr:type 2 isopentenyl-diphosphate Delta-isomerase [Secundilactobacillus angelensis]MCH5461449.1 type 2 isopentenyl-diphosphate Delta-isomerase [Secundilactobacillus angelensis]NLR17738.1 type 2 isopentenyl-diphosphate Delta-isomerase [Secundilactobacillus angelensis]
MTSQQSHRKDEHVSLAEKFHRPAEFSSFDQVRILHQSLPELALSDIDTTTLFEQRRIDYPILIEAMTGGSERTGKLNAQLAQLAATAHLPMAVGSQSVALKEPALSSTFTVVRNYNHDGMVIANLGAGHSVDDARAVVEMVSADALQVHINVAQELIMPEGDREFYWLDQLAAIVAKLNVPVIVKEVGFGMTAKTVQKLMAIGVTAVDLSGRGGTSFAQIENFRRPEKEMTYLNDWGLTTTESLLEMRKLSTRPLIIASGGIKTPLDAIKALALGADIAGMAGEVLHHLIATDYNATEQWLIHWLQDFKRLMLLTGSKTVRDLRKQSMVFSPELESFARQRFISLE